MGSVAMSPHDRIMQISLSQSSKAGTLVLAASASEEQRKLDLETIEKTAAEIRSDWPPIFQGRTCHSPLYIPPSHFEEIRRLQAALNKALVSIVDRWWTDEDAKFPSRMPINDYEEDLLKWIDGPGKKLVPKYDGHQGLYRPDYLFEKTIDANGHPKEQVRICEINGRFPFNGYVVAPNFSKAYAKLGTIPGMRWALDPDEIMSSLLSLFDTSLPLHILREQWPGFDIHLFANDYANITGQAATFITPSSLRLIPSADSPTGSLLYRHISPDSESNPTETITHNNETLERVYQVSIELIQTELAGLSQDILRQVSTCCLNDLRTTLLVHDKRMLGILLEDLDNLVNKYHVLTHEEATTLEKGITPTILPRTLALSSLITSCTTNPTLKDSYVLKAIRSGMALDHIFGNEISNESFLGHLSILRDADLTLEKNLHAVQKRIDQAEWVIVRQKAETPEMFYLIGSYFTVNGRFLASGPLRLGRRVQVRMNDEENGVAMLAITDRREWDEAKAVGK